ncbi:MAG: DedA family protein [Alphaproteobacteria bacterium]|jgi:membrane protein YqaA with SNARE-associated domain|nr:DedA family protein [Alphaproteobacteria bacterium]OJU56666.1 MAG: cytochrome B [Alphaproteobacteria bacterium 62-8]
MNDSTKVASRPGVMRAMYEWMMTHAQGPKAWWALAGVSFAESSFFPIPPDVMLVPMVLADRRRAFVIAAWAMLWSVLGGMLGYAIGAFLYDSVGHWLISAYGYGGELDAFRQSYAEWGAWIILIKGATPIPYKLVTIASGFAGYNLPLFILLSAITRGARFAIVAGLLWYFGEPVRNFIEKRLEWVMLAFLLTIVAGFVIARYVI